MRRSPPITIQREALGSQVAAALREAIAAGDFQPGERLIEVDLAEQYGVSRGPVRDAFRILQAEGLIESQQPGMVVIGIDQGTINEIYSLRGAIEALAVRLSMTNYSPANFRGIEGLVAEMERAATVNDATAFAQADVAFHFEICALSGHRRLADVWQQFEAIMSTLLRLTIFLDQDLSVSAEKHRELLTLMKSGDAGAAEAELAKHLEGSRQRMVHVWEQALERRRNTAQPVALSS